MELDIRKNRIYRNKRYLHLNSKEGKKELLQLYIYKFKYLFLIFLINRNKPNSTCVNPVNMVENNARPIQFPAASFIIIPKISNSIGNPIANVFMYFKIFII